MAKMPSTFNRIVRILEAIFYLVVILLACIVLMSALVGFVKPERGRQPSGLGFLYNLAVPKKLCSALKPRNRTWLQLGALRQLGLTAGGSSSSFQACPGSWTCS